jgi:D-serine deaminase-like pyridoxal phosphate-dependent protein
MFLDSLSPLRDTVGYGALGLHGSLGYEGKAVSVQRQAYPHAISAHPPSRLLFHCGGRFAAFSCQVALNDDVPTGAPLPAIGDHLYLVPRHVCPTVNNFDYAVLVSGGHLTGVERVTARGHEAPIVI